ncbi:MAG: OmpH family outer membrane protein [Pseudomonadota bacterium]
MLIKLQKIVLLSLLILLVPAAYAEKVAVVNLDKAAIDSDYAQQQIKQLVDGEDYKKNVERYQSLRAEVQALQQEGRANELTWSEAQKQAQLGKIRERVEALKKLGAELDSAKADLNRRLLKDLTPQLKQAVEQLVQEKKLDLLLNAQAAYYKAPGTDITEELTQRLNTLKTTD